MSFFESFLHNIFVVLVVLLILKVILCLTTSVSKSNVCLVGKTVLITGGNSGIGYEIALALAGRGARIIIADRDDASNSVDRIIEESNNGNVVYRHIDLTSLASVREFAKKINAEENRLDILINNAGVVTSRKYTEDGLQLVMQTNHFGPFLLTHLLIDLLKKSRPSRIIFVSSIVAFCCDVNLDSVNKTALNGWGNYDKSKLMNIITSNIFAKKLEGSGVTSNAVYPGLVNTPIFQRIGGMHRPALWKSIIYSIVMPVFGKTAWEGAQTAVECALSKELETVNGQFFMECRPFVQPLKVVVNPVMCMKLWEKSEELVHLQDSEKL